MHARSQELGPATRGQGRRRNTYGPWCARTQRFILKTHLHRGDTCVLARDAVHTGVIKLAGYAPGHGTHAHDRAFGFSYSWPTVPHNTSETAAVHSARAHLRSRVRQSRRADVSFSSMCAPPIQRIVSVVILKNRLTGPVCTQVRLHGVYSTPINVLDLVTPYDDGREP